MLDVAKLKIELMSLGLRCDDLPAQVRLGGAGPAEGITVFVQDHAMSVPIQSHYVSRSPFHLVVDDYLSAIYRHKKFIAPVSIPARPEEYDHALTDIPLPQIALLHGRDCLGSTVIQQCFHQERGRGCAFCGIALSLKQGLTIARKTPEQLAWAAQQLRVKHAVLTTGTGADEESTIVYLAECAQALADIGIPAQVQFCPPKDVSLLHGLARVAVSAAINLESPDEHLLRRVAPAKSAIGWPRYADALAQAVRIFGRNQVVSFVIAGLGENDDAIISGVQSLCQMGVYPFLLPLRPIPGTKLELLRPPDPERMKILYQTAAELVIEAGLSWRGVRAGCGRCEACSALPDVEDGQRMRHREVLPAVRPSEIAACLEVRRLVFEEEQGMDTIEQPDELDDQATHLFYQAHGRIIGTVRVYEENGKFWGSRLAVLHESRGGVGKSLVAGAEQEVRRRNGRRIYGKVQVGQVPFFRKLGWQREGEEFCYHGIKHVVMHSAEL